MNNALITDEQRIVLLSESTCALTTRRDAFAPLTGRCALACLRESPAGYPRRASLAPLKGRRAGFPMPGA
jgi:hypothetical protein